MEAYTGFAEVYDTFMDNVPYEEWGAYLCGLLEEYGIRDGIVADLGCGTGTMTEYLAEKGYDMIGIDASEEMLEIAQEKKEKSGYEILYLNFTERCGRSSASVIRSTISRIRTI